MGYEPIITNNAQNKMKQYYISKRELLAAFNSSTIQKGILPGTTTGITRMGSHEICAAYYKDPKGQWVVVSCWKRKHP